MVRSNRFLGYVCGAIAAFAMGCGPGGSTDGGTDGGSDTGGGPGMEYVYVIDNLSIDMDDTASMPHTGFNLDGLFSGENDANGCMFEDFTSMLDPDQNCSMVNAMGMCMASPNMGCAAGSAGCRGGVDNRLPSLANTLGSMLDLRATLSTQITSNQLSLLLRVSDVNDLQNDPNVTVRLYAGYPTRTTDCMTVQAGAEYTISADALMPGATSIDQALFNFQGSIVAGRLRVDGSTSMNGRFMLPLPEIMGMRIALNLYNPQLRINLTADQGTAGNLGGAVRAGEAITAVTQVAPMYASLVRSVIGNLVDIQPMPPLTSGLCYDNMTMMYGSIGMGLGITARSARIATTNTIQTARPAGVCGQPARDM